MGNRTIKCQNRNFENMICNSSKRKKIIRKTEHIENIKKNESRKTKKSRQRRQKEPKETITGKRRETKKKQKRRTKKGRSSALRVPPADTRLTVYRRFHILVQGT